MKRMAAAFLFGSFTLAALPACGQSNRLFSLLVMQLAAKRASRVLSAPNPRRLGLYEVGRQIWQACMRRADHGGHAR